MMRPVSVAQMQQIDKRAIEHLGIPRLLLMEHAGLALAHVVKTLDQNLQNPKTQSPQVLVCCGTGFNGGDGMAAARHLHDWGYTVCVAIVGRADQLQEEPAVYAAILRHLGISLLECPSIERMCSLKPMLEKSDIIVDALLGIGLQGVVRQPMASLIQQINQTGKVVVSADVPSGLDGDTGQPQGCAVRATTTVAFGRPKEGCLTSEGACYTGALIVESITIPRQLLEEP